MYLFLLGLNSLGYAAEEDEFDPIENTSPAVESVSDEEVVENEEASVTTMTEIAPENTADKKIGGGISQFLYFTGVTAFFDYHLDPQTSDYMQFRVIYDFTSTAGTNSSLAINRIFLAADYKFPLKKIKSAYAAVGGGYGQSTLAYKNSGTGQTHSAVGGGLFVNGEIGWEKYWKVQQDRKIFFTAGLNVGFYVVYSDNYDESKISDQTDHRAIVNEGWTAAQQIIQMMAGFGGTF